MFNFDLIDLIQVVEKKFQFQTKSKIKMKLRSLRT